MDWKQLSIDRLKLYQSNVRAADRMREEIERLKAAFESIRSCAADMDAPRNGSSGRHDWALDNIARRVELDGRLKAVQGWVDITARALDGLPDDARRVLQVLYQEPRRNGIDQLCEELGLEKSMVYRRRDAAVRAFAAEMYGEI